MCALSYVIVGSGVFGASTALYLIRKYPHARITLVDRDAYDAPTRVAASWDWNKVVRADYRDITYTRMALEARRLWKADPIWKPFYHESGIFWVSPTSFAEQVLKNYEELGVKAELYSYPVEEARRLYDGLFDDADYTGVKDVLVNKTSGYAEAKEALQKTIEAAVDLQVRYVVAEVTELDFEVGPGSKRRCRGVKTKGGDIIVADRIILCTGSFTPSLLVNSAPSWTDLHAGDRIVAFGVAEAIAPLTADQTHILNEMPVAINELPIGQGCDFGCLPLTKDNALKYWGQWLFRNTMEQPQTGKQMSMPPPAPNYAQWDVPVALKDDVHFASKIIFGRKVEHAKLEKFRICWDALTPSQDFIISPHSACDDLYIATCGSFHGYKFLPVLGKYVVEMLDGLLDPALQKKWAWDREVPATENDLKWTHLELKEFAK